MRRVPRERGSNMAIPTVDDKVILVDFSLTETNAFSLQPIDTQRQFSSTDKGTAFIGFKSENIANGMIADISLANLDDYSRVNRTFTVTTGTNFDATNKIFYYQIPDDEIVHWGNWIGYGKFTDGATSKTWTGTKLKYSISRDITNDPTTKLIVMEDVNAFMDAMNILKADLESYRTTVIQQEVDRVTAENNRVTKEGQRVTAESGRVTAEGGRTTAESGRVTAESGRVTTFAGYNARITGMESDVNVPATNLISNGDFSNGTSGWVPYNATIAIENGRAKVQPTGQWATIGKSIYGVTIGKKFYFRVDIEGGPGLYWGNTNGGFGISSAVNKTFATVITATSPDITFGVGDNKSNSWPPFYVDNLLLIDLTATFGVGNEPTSEQMDRLLTQFPNSWFNGTKNLFLAKWALNELRRLDNEKANKKQEAWIIPTLLNGWTQVSGYAPVSYMKDDFGFVHLRGLLSGIGAVNGSTAFTLPLGYRAPSTIYGLGASSGLSTVQIPLDASGNVKPYAPMLNWVSLDGIAFRVEG